MPDPSCNGADRINCYALVAYIPGQLGAFLDQLRRDLEPNSLAPRAHITILPPRCLSADVPNERAWDELHRKLARVAPFRVEVKEVETFEKTKVVYFAVGDGWDDLLRLHTCLDTGSLRYDEAFEYHPHITVAQKLTPDQAESIRNEAWVRWQKYDGPRSFMVETVSFVQNSKTDLWYDLAEAVLAEPVPSR
ncbi:MAG: 2'-5' RNA ligase family protein [Bryobacterales bacterium]|nr:2'-5' RNA ligase family protein [Bryobacterales bacterium]